jgi:prepilin-type N-terminal cleavage/methylation domain-containing protein/prepilin-type processing-associated H-X9-DG protein
MHRRNKVRAFTLVELLVVIGIIGILIAILLPSLGAARRAANSLSCASNMRTIVQGMQLYAATFKGAIPGSPWTSGAHIRPSTADMNTYAVQGVTVPTNNTDNAPGVVTAFDWQSPIAKMFKIQFNEGPTLADRTERFRQLNALNSFTCPDNELLMFELPFSSPLGTTGTFKYTSYSTSIDFMLLRSDSSRGWTFSGGYVGRSDGSGAIHEPPQGYVPRITRVGNPARKAFLGEGARFVDSGGYPIVRINFDAGFVSQNGGLYSAERPWVGNPQGFNRSRLLFGRYGDPAFAAVTPQRMAADSRYILAFARHGTRNAGAALDAYRANVAFFDGHVETLSVPEMMNPEFWSPKGTELRIVDSPATQAQIYPSIRQKYFPGQNNFQWTAP